VKSQQFCKEVELALGKCLDENIGHILVGYIVQLNLGIFDSLTDEMVPNIDMLGTSMKFVVLC
jgi:hypothetical protein